jgi:hypothetical protein
VVETEVAIAVTREVIFEPKNHDKDLHAVFVADSNSSNEERAHGDLPAQMRTQAAPPGAMKETTDGSEATEQGSDLL